MKKENEIIGKFCRQCGERLWSEGGYCHQCGTKVFQQIPRPISNRHANQTVVPWKLICAMIVAAVITSSALYVNARQQSQSLEFSSDGQARHNQQMVASSSSQNGASVANKQKDSPSQANNKTVAPGREPVQYLDGEITSVDLLENVEEDQPAVANVTVKNTGNKGGMFKLSIKSSYVFYTEKWIDAGESQIVRIEFKAKRWDDNVVISL